MTGRAAPRLASRQSIARVFAWPAAIAVASIAGLVLGLNGDGLPDYLAWLLVGAGPAVIFAVLLRRTS
ncbi:hypothetical protein [Qipengyuania sp. JC766]|uniref:hypothetical protein n=1 Tax=Qipengyuania sp. JC766 TaxID=3232139 RepID=UPI00345A8427